MTSGNIPPNPPSGGSINDKYRSFKGNFFVDRRHIAKGTTIISDCWKAYINLEKHGYEHRLVNHSKQFVNSEGFHTNKIEGHWRKAKSKMPCFGVRKITFSSHLAEFLCC
jgi:hypothetical protein